MIIKRITFEENQVTEMSYEQNNKKRRDDQVVNILQLTFCQIWGFEAVCTWYNHPFGRVLESKKGKNLCDFQSETDKRIEKG